MYTPFEPVEIIWFSPSVTDVAYAGGLGPGGGPGVGPGPGGLGGGGTGGLGGFGVGGFGFGGGGGGFGAGGVGRGGNGGVGGGGLGGGGGGGGQSVPSLSSVESTSFSGNSVPGTLEAHCSPSAVSAHASTEKVS